MALSESQAAQVLVQARGAYEIHESALIHEALTPLGPKLGLVAEQVPAEVSAPVAPAPSNE
jgi:hypothetical protein